MRILVITLLLMIFSYSALADSQRAAGIIEVLKSPQFMIQFTTDGSKKIVGGVTVLPRPIESGPQKVTLIKDGDREFVSVEFSYKGKVWTNCCLKEKERCTNYYIFNGTYYNEWQERPISLGRPYSRYSGERAPSVIDRHDLLFAENEKYDPLKGKIQRYADYYNDLMDYLGISVDDSNYPNPVTPVKLKGSYKGSGQETINGVTYDYDEFWDETTPKFVAKNRYYFKDGKFDRFISLGDGVCIDYYKYAYLYLHPGKPLFVDFKQENQANVVTINMFTNTVDPSTLEFPAHVRVIDIPLEKTYKKRDDLEFMDQMMTEYKKQRYKKKKELLQAIKDVIY